jgi:hypothetical protein
MFYGVWKTETCFSAVISHRMWNFEFKSFSRNLKPNQPNGFSNRNFVFPIRNFVFLKTKLFVLQRFFCPTETSGEIIEVSNENDSLQWWNVFGLPLVRCKWWQPYIFFNSGRTETHFTTMFWARTERNPLVAGKRKDEFPQHESSVHTRKKLGKNNFFYLVKIS